MLIWDSAVSTTVHVAGILDAGFLRLKQETAAIGNDERVARAALDLLPCVTAAQTALSVVFTL